MSVKLSKIAQQDMIDLLAEGIIQFGEYQAGRYQASLYSTFDLLSGMPALGRRSERHVPDERRFPHGPHVIYYHAEGSGIVIDTIVRASLIRDLWGDDL